MGPAKARTRCLLRICFELHLTKKVDRLLPERAINRIVTSPFTHLTNMQLVPESFSAPEGSEGLAARSGRQDQHSIQVSARVHTTGDQLQSGGWKR